MKKRSKNRWNKNKAKWAKKWNNKKGRGGGKMKIDEETRTNMRRMKNSMKELGECAPIVRKTMMSCFLVADEGVRGVMGATETQQGDPFALNDATNQEIAQDIGKCYKEGLDDLTECL